MSQNLTVYGIKTCSTVRKAIKELQASDYAVTFRDVRAKDMGPSDWQYLEGKVGWDALLNRKSQAWRNVEDAKKENLNTDAVLELLMEKPNLMKRPAIDRGDQVTLGWKDDVKAEYGL